MKHLLCWLLIGFSALPLQAKSYSVLPPTEDMPNSHWFAPTRGDPGPRSVYWRPLLSFFLPGFDQYLAGHDASGLTYSTVWLGAGLWARNRSDKLKTTEEDMQWDRWEKPQQDDYRNHEELPRQATLASQYITAVGAMSAWHSFRTSAETQKAEGRYQFLKVDETPRDLLLAPFRFSYVDRKTTWIPLLIAAGIGALGTQFYEEKYQKDPLSTSDAAYASALSFNAGVSEEALFRGYMQPVLYESWGSPFWANATQALVFSAAHLGTNNRPLPQLAMGFYLGWLQQNREWTLGEGIFIHAWWDVIAISSSYLVRLQDKERGPPPVLWLPTLTWML